MANPWFRMYAEAVDDNKLRLLAFEDRWHFVALLCLKTQGVLDADPKLLDRSVAVKLGLQLRDLDEVRRRLMEVGLIDENWQPLAWEDRQFLSDSSVERVRRHREKRKASGLSAQKNIPEALRKSIFSRDNFECVYCESKDDLTIDHKVPESLGGDDSEDNLQCACRACNAQKRDMTDEQYREYLKQKDVTLLKRPKNKNTDTDKETDKSKNTVSLADLIEEGADPQEAKDWLLVRKQKRAPLTQTAMNGVRREAKKAGLTIPQAIQMCAQKGWQGFDASWVVGAKPVKSTSERHAGFEEKDYSFSGGKI